MFVWTSSLCSSCSAEALGTQVGLCDGKFTRYIMYDKFRGISQEHFTFKRFHNVTGELCL